MSGPSAGDWTVGPSGSCNSSDAYKALVEAVERLIREDAHSLIARRAGDAARLIMAHLAHEHGVGPILAAEAAARRKMAEEIVAFVRSQCFCMATPEEGNMEPPCRWCVLADTIARRFVEGGGT